MYKTGLIEKDHIRFASISPANRSMTNSQATQNLLHLRSSSHLPASTCFSENQRQPKRKGEQ